MGRPAGVVPHYLPETKPYLGEYGTAYELDIVQFLFRNPHSFVQIEEQTPSGPVRWSIEWAAPGSLAQQGVVRDIFKAGDHVVVTGSLAALQMTIGCVCCRSSGPRMAGDGAARTSSALANLRLLDGVAARRRAAATRRAPTAASRDEGVEYALVCRGYPLRLPIIRKRLAAFAISVRPRRRRERGGDDNAGAEANQKRNTGADCSIARGKAFVAMPDKAVSCTECHGKDSRGATVAHGQDQGPN